MGQQLRTRTRFTISLASTASPKSVSFSMPNCLASPCLPSSISCWYFVSFMVMVMIFQWNESRRWSLLLLGRCLARDCGRGVVAHVRRVDLHPVAGLDGRDGVLVQAVHGGDFAGNGAADVDRVDFVGDDGDRAVI